jgi:hypothetical protein
LRDFAQFLSELICRHALHPILRLDVDVLRFHAGMAHDIGDRAGMFSLWANV